MSFMFSADMLLILFFQNATDLFRLARLWSGMPLDVVCLGDSLMSSLFRYLNTGGRLTFSDYSKRGAHLAPYFDSELVSDAIETRPAIAVLWLGSNNIPTYDGSDRQLFIFLVTRYIRRLERANIRVYIIGMPNRFNMGHFGRVRYRLESAAYNRHFERAMRFRYIKLPTYLAYNINNYPDGVHLTDHVMQVVARCVRRRIRHDLRS